MSVSTVKSPIFNATSWISERATTVAGSLSETASKVKTAVVNFFSYAAVRLVAFWNAARTVVTSGFNQIRASFSALPAEGKWAVAAASLLTIGVGAAIGRIFKKAEAKPETATAKDPVQGDAPASNNQVDAAAAEQSNQ